MVDVLAKKSVCIFKWGIFKFVIKNCAGNEK